MRSTSEHPFPKSYERVILRTIHVFPPPRTAFYSKACHEASSILCAKNCYYTYESSPPEGSIKSMDVFVDSTSDKMMETSSTETI